MKKIILTLQILSLIGMISAMVALFIADSHNELMFSLTSFSGFSLIAVLAIVLDEKNNRKINI
jgi:hypothetical protein